MDLSLLVWGDDGWGDEMVLGAVMTLAVQTRSDLRAEATKLEKPAHELQPPVC